MLVVDVSSESSDLLELETLLAIASKETMKTYCSDTDSILRLLVYMFRQVQAATVLMPPILRSHLGFSSSSTRVKMVPRWHYGGHYRLEVE